jgi:hypothetical protein
MKDTSKQKFVSDVHVGKNRIRARKPFRVEEDNSRRYIRLEISSPMSLNKIKDVFGNFWPGENTPVIHGTILNISAGGLLVECDQPLNEGDIVSMRFTLQDVEALDNVLGLVKRCDPEEGCSLAGIEFISRNRLEDKLTSAEMELLTEKVANFHQSVQKVLERYLYHEQTA